MISDVVMELLSTAVQTVAIAGSIIYAFGKAQGSQEASTKADNEHKVKIDKDFERATEVIAELVDSQHKIHLDITSTNTALFGRDGRGGIQADMKDFITRMDKIEARIDRIEATSDELRITLAILDPKIRRLDSHKKQEQE